MTKQITAAEFTRIVGREPQLDDLERANCQEAGATGHWGCGLCEHGKPTYLCAECFAASANPIRNKS
jgi:hypothetical protein